MTFLATTRVAVIRGTIDDPLGDEVDANGGSPVAGYESLPASLIERSRSVFDPATGTRRTVRYIAGRLPGNVVLQKNDRIRDNATGIVYALSEKTVVARSVAGLLSLTLELTQA